MRRVDYKGGTHVITEAGEGLAMLPLIAKVALPNGSFAQVKRAFVDAATNDTTELIPAVADAAVRVLSLVMLQGGTAGSVVFLAASTAISCAFANAANGGVVLPFNTAGWLQTADVNQALNVQVSDSSNCGVLVNYIEIPADCFDLL